MLETKRTYHLGKKSSHLNLCFLAKRFIENKKEGNFQNQRKNTRRLGYFENFWNDYSIFRVQIVKMKQVLKS
jgi:hypothetical protein